MQTRPKCVKPIWVACHSKPYDKDSISCKPCSFNLDPNGMAMKFRKKYGYWWPWCPKS